ncbi:MAG: DUF3784 domain-containing protein [Clostridia bacterium]|nr:DUF3784 domain-containing protein [Clostridia bacterium]
MTAPELISAIAVFTLAGVFAIISIMSFVERGYLINNAYIYASEEERKKMDKKPYYRQSAIVFCLLGIMFTVVGISIVVQNYQIELLEIPLAVGTVIYAVVSSSKINNRTNSSRK